MHAPATTWLLPIDNSAPRSNRTSFQAHHVNPQSERLSGIRVNGTTLESIMRNFSSLSINPINVALGIMSTSLTFTLIPQDLIQRLKTSWDIFWPPWQHRTTATDASRESRRDGSSDKRREDRDVVERGEKLRKKPCRLKAEQSEKVSKSNEDRDKESERHARERAKRKAAEQQNAKPREIDEIKMAGDGEHGLQADKANDALKKSQAGRDSEGRPIPDQELHNDETDERLTETSISKKLRRDDNEAYASKRRARDRDVKASRGDQLMEARCASASSESNTKTQSGYHTSERELTQSERARRAKAEIKARADHQVDPEESVGSGVMKK